MQSYLVAISHILLRAIVESIETNMPERCVQFICSRRLPKLIQRSTFKLLLLYLMGRIAHNVNLNLNFCGKCLMQVKHYHFSSLAVGRHRRSRRRRRESWKTNFNIITLHCKECYASVILQNCFCLLHT